METDSDAMNLSDPISYAKYLCDSAGLTREQRAPVMLIATDMQEVYGMEVERRARLTEAQRRSEGLDATDVVRLPLVGRRLRLLLYGGVAAERHESSLVCLHRYFDASTARKV